MSSAPKEGVVLVGNKPPMNYVLAIVIQFQQGCDRVVIKARGSAIKRAIDAALLTRDKFLKGQIDIEKVSINSETVGEPGKQRTVSTIEIVLTRKKE